MGRYGEMDQDDADAIGESVKQLLDRAGTRQVFPTPVHELIAAQNLRVAADDECVLAPHVLAQAPRHLRERLEGVSHKVLALLDRTERQVYLDPSGLSVQKRFWICHEIGHDLCPWHGEDIHVDGAEQLDPDVREEFEVEANYAAGLLLFQHDVFTLKVQGIRPDFALVKRMAALFGGSLHAAFHMLVETSPYPAAGVVLDRAFKRESVHPLAYHFRVKRAFASPTFRQEYPLFDEELTWLDTTVLAFRDLASAWHDMTYRSGTGGGRLLVNDRSGKMHYLPFEIFDSTYNLLLLVWRP